MRTLLLTGALLAGGAAAAPAQDTRLQPPDLSTTQVALSLTLTGADSAGRSYTMKGSGGCQNLGDADRPRWMVGWSAPDGSELFTLTVQALPDGRTEERLLLKPRGERSFSLTTVGGATIRTRGAGVRFTLAGKDAAGRALKGTVNCAGQTT